MAQGSIHVGLKLHGSALLITILVVFLIILLLVDSDPDQYLLMGCIGLIILTLFVMVVNYLTGKGLPEAEFKVERRDDDEKDQIQEEALEPSAVEKEQDEIPDTSFVKEDEIMPTKKYQPWTEPENIVCLQLYLYHPQFNQGTGRPHILLKYINEEIRKKFNNRTVGGLDTQVQGYAQHDPNPGAVKKNKSSKGREDVWNKYHDMDPKELTDLSNDILDRFP